MRVAEVAIETGHELGGVDLLESREDLRQQSPNRRGPVDVYSLTELGRGGVLITKHVLNRGKPFDELDRRAFHHSPDPEPRLPAAARTFPTAP